VTICSDAADATAAARLAAQHEGIWCTAGIHPHQAAAAGRADLDRIADLLEEKKVVAVGETGLDYYYDNAPRNLQRKLLAQHVQLAADLALPVVVHSREADHDTIAMIRSIEGEVLGVLHCFAGNADLLEAGIEAGWLISFSGLVTFKNYDGQDLVRSVPAEQLLVETDSPYLAPIPHRGKRNEPAYVREVAREVARLRGVAEAELAAVTTSNALRFYGLAQDAGQLQFPVDEPAS
ncbi:MAG TPA: TatD family hydrolase, partial [Longimicrobiales bacterium]|nr:TatD family hydrolase [Longimicrobiales bacterium]